MTHLIHAATRHVVALTAGLLPATVAPAAPQAPVHLRAASDRIDALATAVTFRTLVELTNAGR